jgi:hypothetical protein
MVYVPNTRNVPLLTKKAEIQGSAQIGPFGTDFQMAGALTNHIALMSNYAYYNNKAHAFPFHLFNMSNHFFEGGIGYFRSDERQNKRLTFEVFAGYGRGHGYYNKAESHDGAPPGAGVLVLGDYQRFFAQPAIGFHTPSLDLGGALRVSLVDFQRLSFNTEITHPRTALYVEPSIILKMNLYQRRIYMLATAGINFGPQGGLGKVYDVPVAPPAITLSTGLGFRINGAKFSTLK